MLADYLGHAGFRVSAAEDGATLRRLLEDQAADLVILDINMPGEDGLSLARYLRANTKIGIIMLTAAGEVVDRIVGLEMGADDYLPSRSICASCWRASAPCCAGWQQRPTSRPPNRPAEKIGFGACQFDLEPTGCTTPTARRSPITSMEFDLLRRSPSIRTGCSVATSSWIWRTTGTGSRSTAASTSASPGCAARSRPIPSKPQVIKTVRGAGYIFVPDGEEPARL